MLKRRVRKSASPTTLAFEHVALLEKGPTLSFAVPAGSTVAVVGPASSGKSKFLSVLTGQERPARGDVFHPDAIAIVEEIPPARREKPRSIAKRSLDDGDSTRIAEVLSALGLWDDRSRSLAGLGASQQVAARFIAPLIESPAMVVSDGDLDLLDPWTRTRLWRLLQSRRSEGLTFVYSTNIPAIAEAADLVIVLKEQQVLFSDSPQALARSISAGTISVATNDHAGTRALASPFEVNVTETAEGFRFEAAEGQQLAAKLLLEGYGDVKFVLLKNPSFEEALRILVG